MLNSFRLIILSFSITFLFSQTTHVVKVTDGFYTPSPLTIDQGDTVTWNFADGDRDCEDFGNGSGGEGHDSDGPVYNCEWYSSGNNCLSYGDGFTNFGMTANEACCACGGGTIESLCGQIPVTIEGGEVVYVGYNPEIEFNTTESQINIDEYGDVPILNWGWGLFQLVLIDSDALSGLEEGTEIYQD